MSSSRARTRVAALSAAIPVLIAAGPLVHPAAAADPFVVSNLIQDGQVVGPNAGYLGLGIGQNGTAAMFKITAPDTTSTISSVELSLTQIDNAFSWQYQSELDAADGLALYADVDQSGTFDAGDKAAGNKASGFGLARTPSATEVPLKVSFATPVSGATTYFLAIHPKSNPVTSGRRFAFRIDPGGIVTSNGNVPVQAVSTPLKTDTADPRMRVDSAAPAEPLRTYFTSAPHAPGIEDEYTVSADAAGGDPTAKVVFFNAPTNTAESAVLRRPEFNPAVPPGAQPQNLALHTIIDGTAATKTVKIGDGTGAQPDQPALALNNQINNAVYPAVVDAVGNISPRAVLSDCFVAPDTTVCETARGNPVVAPVAPSLADMSDGVAIEAINQGNYRAVPVLVNAEADSTRPRTDRAGTAKTNADKYSRAVGLSATIVQRAPDGSLDMTRTTGTKTKPAPANGATGGSFGVAFVATDAFDTIESATAPRGIQQGLGIATVVATAVDRAGNRSTIKTAVDNYTKDITSPTVSIRSDSATPTKGSKVRVWFSEPMKSSSVFGSTEQNGTCVDETRDGYAEKALDVKTPTGEDRTWGFGYCYTWNSDFTGATITLGDPALRVDGRLPSLNDHVHLVGNIVDKWNNKITDDDGVAPFFTKLLMASATPIEGRTVDLNRDGKLDAVDMSFTTSLDSASFDAAKSNLTAVGAGTTVPITSITAAAAFPNDNRPVYRFKFASEFDTAQLPQIRLAKPAGGDTALKDVNNTLVGEFAKTPRDFAFPVPVRAVTVDAGATDGKADGKLDRIVLTYSEPIVPDKDNNPAPANLNQKAYDVTGYTPPAEPGRQAYNKVSPTTGEPSATKVIELAQPGTFDSGVTPAVNFRRFTTLGGVSYGPTDPAGNQWTTTVTTAGETFTVAPADGAAPFIVSRSTADTDLNGLIDAVDVVFSEPLPTGAVGGQFAISGRTIRDQADLGTNGIRLKFQEATDTTGDTNARPTIQYLGGVTDLAGNPLPAETAPVQTTDGAGPAIVGACAQWATGVNGSCPIDDEATTDDGTKINVFLSEPTATATVEAADFAVEQTAAKPVTGVTPIAAVSNAASSFTLSFAANAINPLEDFSIKFTGVDKVDDLATPVAKNKQTGPVTGLGGPVATLDLTCSVDSDDPDFCPSTTIQTGIENSASVIAWRLKPTARGAVVDSADYVSTRPGTITLVEQAAPHTLYLTGMDKFGRLSNPEATDTMAVLTPPTIENVQMANSNSLATKDGQWSRINTVRDGDVLSIKADAFGADAAEWATMATGGGCLADHMSINLQGVTGSSLDANRAPTRCDMKSGTERPGRQMIFPAASVKLTTKYPVGTVVKYTSTDPGALIVDGPNGTLARRHFISAAARKSWAITDASVVTVPKALVAALPRQANIGYRDGAILKNSATGGYYYVERGVKRPVSVTRLNYWRISTARAYVPTSAELKAIPTGTTIGSNRHADGTWIKYNDGRIYQIVRNAQGVSVRRKLASYAALASRVPSTQVYPANLADNGVPLDSSNWLIGYRDGVMVRFGTTNPTFGVISRGSLRMFANAQTFNSLGFNAANAVAVNELAMPRVSGQAYRTGTAIDRYKITSVVIKVTNKVGSATTATVLPAYGGIYGIGTIDPRPAGWDSTR